MRVQQVRLQLLMTLLLLAASVAADPVLEVAKKSVELGQVEQLGVVEVDGVGSVHLSARRNDMQVVIKASGPGQELLGRAETTIGLAETPVYIRTPDGLRKITVVWGAEGK